MRLEPLTVEVITYAPTEFFHCTHCEVVFQQVGVGQKIHAEQREANLPEDLKTDFARISAECRQVPTKPITGARRLSAMIRWKSAPDWRCWPETI